MSFWNCLDGNWWGSVLRGADDVIVVEMASPFPVVDLIVTDVWYGLIWYDATWCHCKDNNQDRSRSISVLDARPILPQRWAQNHCRLKTPTSSELYRKDLPLSCEHHFGRLAIMAWVPGGRVARRSVWLKLWRSKDTSMWQQNEKVAACGSTRKTKGAKCDQALRPQIGWLCFLYLFIGPGASK